MGNQKTNIKREERLEKVEILNKMGYRIDLNKNITRTVKKYIVEAIEETNSNNRYELCFYISDLLEKAFKGEVLEYQLKRMDLNTTGDILKVIDTYMYKKKLIRLEEWD